MDYDYNHNYYQNQIHDAILAGDISSLDNAITEIDDFDINRALYMGEPSLILATRHLQYGVMEYLLDECNADVDIKDSEGNTPLLIVSIITDDVDFATLLINKGADEFVTNYEGLDTPLIISARSNHLNIVKLLIGDKGNGIETPVDQLIVHANQRNIEGHTPLMMASLHGALDVVDYLITTWYRPSLGSSVSIDELDWKSRTALHYAVISESIPIIRLLLLFGADPDKEDEEGETPSGMAIDRHLSLQDIILIDQLEPRIREGNNILIGQIYTHIENGGLKEVRDFITLNRDNLLGDEHWQANTILFAVEQDQLEIIKFLLEEEKFNPNQMTNNTSYPTTPLIGAVRENNTSACLLLINNGADPMICDSKNRSPLYYACRKGLLVIAKIILQKGDAVKDLLVNILDKDKYSPLHIAIQSDRFQLVKYLLSTMTHSIKIDETNKRGETPLVTAIKSQLINFVEILLSYGANPNYQSTETTHLPLEVAVDIGALDITEKLLRAGASLKLGTPPLEISVMNDDWYMSNLLIKAGAVVTQDIIGNARNPNLKNLLVSSGSNWRQVCSYIKRNNWRSGNIRKIQHIAGRLLPIMYSKIKKIHPIKLCRILARYHTQQEEIFLNTLTSLQFRAKRKFRNKEALYRLPSDWKLMCEPEEGKRLFVTITNDLNGNCFDHDMLDWSFANRMCLYVPQSGRKPEDIEAMGFGSQPTKQYFLPLPLEKGYRGYINLEDFNLIVRKMEKDSHEVLMIYLGSPVMTRIGNCQGSFGESELHGQYPGEPVYPIDFIKTIGSEKMQKYLDNSHLQNTEGEVIKGLQSELMQVNQQISILQEDVGIIHNLMDQENLNEDQLKEKDRQTLLTYREQRNRVVQIMRQLVSLR